MPPTMVAMNAMSTMLTPIAGETVPVRAVSRIAAAPASTPETANADATTVFARIPSTRAMRKSSAAARIWVPWVVRRKNSSMAASSAAVTPTVITSSFWITTSPSANESRPDAKPVVRGSVPHVRAAPFCSRKLSAKDMISSVAGAACLAGRKAMRSMTRASATTATSVSGTSAAPGSGTSTST